MPEYFTHITDDQQISYRPSRSALVEWWRGPNRWIHAGYLYEGNVHTLDDAKRLTAEYLSIFTTKDES